MIIRSDDWLAKELDPLRHLPYGQPPAEDYPQFSVDLEEAFCENFIQFREYDKFDQKLIYSRSSKVACELVKHVINQLIIKPELMDYIHPLPVSIYGYCGGVLQHSYPLGGFIPNIPEEYRNYRVALETYPFEALKYYLPPPWGKRLKDILAAGERYER